MHHQKKTAPFFQVVKFDKRNHHYSTNIETTTTQPLLKMSSGTAAGFPRRHDYNPVIDFIYD